MYKKIYIALTLAVATLSAQGVEPEVSVADLTAGDISAELGVKPEGRRLPMRRTMREGAKKTHRAASRKAAPQKVVAESAGIYGWLGYTDDDTLKEGLYQFTESGPALKWADPQFTAIQNGWEVLCSWLSADGSKICGYSGDSYYGNLQDIAYVEMDFETGKLLKNVAMDVYNDPVPNVAALNPADGYIYMMGFTAEGEPYMGRASAGDPTKIETVRGYQGPDDLLCSMTYCAADGNFYAVSSAKNFVRFGTDFNMTPVIESLPIDNLQTFITGLCYSASDNLFYWNVNASNPDAQFVSLSSIYTIDAAAGALEKVASLTDNDEYISMYCPARADDDAPGTPEYSGNTFDKGALSGAVKFKVPSVTEGGGSLSGMLDWNIALDGTQAADGQAQAGSTVEVPFNSLTQGFHQFTFQVCKGDKKSNRTTANIYIGNDTPMAPAEVKLTDTQVSWSAVTEGVNGGYVDAAQMTYKVYLNDVSIGVFNTTSAPVTIDTQGDLTAYRAKVEAVCNGKSSDLGVSNKLLAGNPLELDVNIRPTATQWDLCILEDGNEDGNTWVLYDESDDSFFNSQFSGNGDADDWIFLPPMNFNDAAPYYSVSYQGRSRSEAFPEEYIEVRIGKEPAIESMTQVIIPKTQMVTAWKEYSGLFQIPAAGTYYVAVRNMSGYDQYGVFVKNINVSRTEVRNDSPSTVTGLSAEALPQGELKAKVTFAFPSVRMDGTYIDGDTRLTAEVKGTGTATVTGKPGERVSAEVATGQGANTISVRVLDGEKAGPAATVGVYTGVVIPARVENLKAAVEEDNATVVLSWDAPAIGEDGGYVDPATVSYVIYIYTEGGWLRLGNAGAGETTFTYNGKDEYTGDLQVVQLGVLSANVAGNNNKVSVVAMSLGKPYPLPMSETFDETDANGYCVPSLEPWMMYAPTSDYESKWGFSRLSNVSADFSDIPGGALVSDPDGKATKGRMALPKFSTACLPDEKVLFMMRTYTGANCAAEVKLLGETYGQDGFTELAVVKPGKEAWTDTAVELPAEFTGRKWIQLYLDVDFTKGNQLFLLDEYRADATKSGIASAGSDVVRVYGGYGEIRVLADRFDCASVYSADGRLLSRGPQDRITMPAGIYLVNVDGRTFKVQVK